MRLAAIFALVALVGCDSINGPPPERADYTLMFYAKQGTDYGPVIPGYRTLEECHHAGVSMTMAAIEASQAALPEPPPGYPPLDPDDPWFECATKCRPFAEGSFLRRCRHTKEYHGEEARNPR